MRNPNTLTEDNIGCWLDNHRGHYITRDAILLAQSLGFILGSFEQFVVDKYDDCGSDEDYPYEGLVDLCDEALAWLNSSPDEREFSGQNMPPARPSDAYWDWFDGDFGLYIMDEDGEPSF